MKKKEKFAWEQFFKTTLDPEEPLIQEFIVYKKPNSDSNEYVIVKCDQSKEQNLEMLNLIQEILNNTSHLSPKQIIDYCKSQRYFMKQYFRQIQNQKEDLCF